MKAGFALLCGLVLALSGAVSPDWSWEEMAPGLDLAKIPSPRGKFGDGRIIVLRAEPEKWTLDVLCRKGLDLNRGLTAKQWCNQYGLVAAINAGMFATDHTTHVGYLKTRGHLNNARVNSYQSVAAFGSTADHLPEFGIFDRDLPDTDWDELVANYSHVVQNLRLIKRPGENRWSKQEKRWSEAALGEDKQGRVLMIFCRTPYSMHDLNEQLLALDIDLVAAQHLEGGPEAQLYLKVGDGFEGFGSYETDFLEDDSNARAWPIPNVIGLRPREQ